MSGFLDSFEGAAGLTAHILSTSPLSGLRRSRFATKAPSNQDGSESLQNCASVSTIKNPRPGAPYLFWKIKRPREWEGSLQRKVALCNSPAVARSGPAPPSAPSIRNLGKRSDTVRRTVTVQNFAGLCKQAAGAPDCSRVAYRREAWSSEGSNRFRVHV